MEATLKITIPAAKILEAKVQEDGTCELVISAKTLEENEVKVISEVKEVESDFILVKASDLSLEDDFIKNYEPKTKAERELKGFIISAIQMGIKDFYRPKIDPSFDETGKGITFEAGKMPAIGKSYNWWVKAAKSFKERRGSRLGTRMEYVAFMGVLIKELVASGWEISDAWNAVCNESSKLGHYKNSPFAEFTFEPTGSRPVCGFFDLANVFKILAEDEDFGGFWLAGGIFYEDSVNCALSGHEHGGKRWKPRKTMTGWVVLER